MDQFFSDSDSQIYLTLKVLGRYTLTLNGGMVFLKVF